MNTLEQSLTTSTDRAQTGAGPAPGTPLARSDSPSLGGPLSTAGRTVAKLLNMFGNPPFEFVLWNGERILPVGKTSIARITVKDSSVLWGMLRNPGVRFGDAYSEGQHRYRR